MIPAMYSPRFRAFDANGKPLVGGQLFTYAAGTLTNQQTFTDSTNDVPNTNPVILDSTGQANVFLGPDPYKFILQDMNGVQQWSADNITQDTGSGSGEILGGAWDSGINYTLPGAVVQYAGNFYLGLLPSTAVVPGTAPATWALIGSGAPPPAFTITSFTGGETVELGFAVVNPVFNATYSGAPTSASIANTDAINSPLALTSPFLTATITGSFSHSVAHDTTFTLTAIGASTQTATQDLKWEPRIFSGTGTGGGATGATASGTSAVLVGDTGTLPSFQLGAETVGTTFVFNLTGNYFYMLLIGAGHTFNVNGFPATLASTPVTFVNANGVSVSMNLYVAPTFGTGTYTVVVTG